MPARSFFRRLPRPVSFALYGAAAGLLAALTAGELVWHALAPPAAEALPAPPATSPLPRLFVTASPAVSVYPGEANTVAVRVARDRFDGPVTVAFAAPGISAAEVPLPIGETSGRAVITAAATAKPGAYTLTITATTTADGRALSASATGEVTVVAPPPQPAGPRLAVTVSPAVQVYPRGKNAFTVSVARDGFDDEVTVTFDRLPGGVTGPPVTIPKGRSEAAAELTADASARPGTYTFAVRAAPKGAAVAAEAAIAVTVLSIPKVPVDLALALDCTGSMEKAVAGIAAALPPFAAALAKADLDVRFGLVGFQDTTLGQRLKVPRIDGERMTDSAARLGAAMTGLRLGGGGGEGDSSLDGIAEAADCPFREPAVRVVLLVTDGGPKKIDGRMRSMGEAVKYLRAKKIDQLHVVALPEHRKAFEPLSEGAKGAFFDLGAANASGDYDTPLAGLAKAVCDALPARPENRPEASGAAPQPALPPAGSVKPPALPPGAEPDEPKVTPAIPVVGTESQPQPPVRGRLVVLLAVGAISGCLFGLVFGLMLPLSEKLFRANPTAEPLELDPEPVVLPVIKPAITAPKPRDGCPGCGRTIPGEAGKRYCMVCDNAF